MEIEINSKIRAKALYDAGETTAIGISRGAGVSERIAYRYLKQLKEGEFHRQAK